MAKSPTMRKAGTAPKRPAVAGYTTAAVARILGVKEGRVRTFVQSGFVTPARGKSNEYRFSFQDIVVLRAAQGLLTSKISKPKVRQALAKLKSALPAGRSLTELKIYAEGGEVVARSGQEVWDAQSGQRRFDFDVASLAETVEPLARKASHDLKASTDDFDADDWFGLAVEWEATAFDEAKSAYRSALALGDAHAEAHLNLGRLLHEEGELAEAETHYRRAHELDSGDVTAVFNLGVVLQDQRRWPEAIEAYESAVRLESEFPDVHFNLATLYEATGDKAGAIRSLKAYKRLVDG